MIRLLKDERGSGGIYGLMVLLVLILLFSVISEYLRMKLIADGVYAATESAVIAVATQNYDEVYSGLRQSYSGAYELEGGKNWKAQVDSGSVMGALSRLLILEDGRKMGGASLEYEISELKVIIDNPSLAPTTSDQRFQAKVDLILIIPLAFGWDHLPPLVIPMEVKAAYTNKF